MKAASKHFASLIATILVLPGWLFFRLGAQAVGQQRAFAGWSQAFSLLPGVSGAYLRWALYRLLLPQCGAGAWISFGTILSHSTARIGSNVYIGAFCVLGDVTLEDDVLIGSHASVINGARQHGTERLDIPVREQPGVFPRVTIGRDSWIGERAVVMADVGEHCVVAAGAVVTKPVAAYAIVAGVPAKMIGDRRKTNAHNLSAQVVCSL